MVTIYQFLCASPETVQATMDGVSEHVRVSVLKDVKNFRWEMVGSALEQRLAELLDISLIEVVLRGWKKYAMVRKYTGPDAPSTDEMVLIPLSEHTIRSEHKPHIEILRGGKEVARITFPVILELCLDGFALKIRNQRIEEIQTGKLLASGTLKCEGVAIVEKKLQPIELPGSIRLPLRATSAAGA